MTDFPDNIYNPADVALQVARTDPDRIAVIEPCGRDPSGQRCTQAKNGMEEGTITRQL